MIEKFNGIFYLILFVIHFLGVGAYAYQMIIGNQKFREKFQIDETAATYENDRRYISGFFLDGNICYVCKTKWC